MADQEKWFFAESVDTKEWDLLYVFKDEGETESQFAVGQTLSVAARELRNMQGEWIVRLVPDQEQQDLLNLLDGIDSYVGHARLNLALGGIVLAAVEADRQNRTTRRKKSVD